MESLWIKFDAIFVDSNFSMEEIINFSYDPSQSKNE